MRATRQRNALGQTGGLTVNLRKHIRLTSLFLALLILSGCAKRLIFDINPSLLGPRNKHLISFSVIGHNYSQAKSILSDLELLADDGLNYFSINTNVLRYKRTDSITTFIVPTVKIKIDSLMIYINNSPSPQALLGVSDKTIYPSFALRPDIGPIGIPKENDKPVIVSFHLLMTNYTDDEVLYDEKVSLEIKARENAGEE